MLIKELMGKRPKYGEGCYFAENATVIGDVEMGGDSLAVGQGDGQRAVRVLLECCFELGNGHGLVGDPPSSRMRGTSEGKRY